MKRPRRHPRATIALLSLALGGASTFACSSSSEHADVPNQVGSPSSGAVEPLRDTTNAVVVDLGEVAPGEEVPLEVPANTLGFVVIAELPPGAPRGIGIRSIVSPSGEYVHSLFAPVGTMHQTGISERDLVTAAVPQNASKSATPPEPGTWKLTFATAADAADAAAPEGGTDAGTAEADAADAGTPGATSTAKVRVSVLLQIGPPDGFVGGRLDLDVWIPSGLTIESDTVNAADAPHNNEVTWLLESFFRRLSQHFKIDRGNVRFHDAPPELRVVNSDDLLNAAFAVSRGEEDRQTFNVVLTNAISFGGDVAWGVAGGLPGAVGRAGTTKSGAVVVVGEGRGSEWVLLHEFGHFAGLLHTTEVDGRFTDTLSDTPECEAISRDDVSSLARCPDAPNFMFPITLLDVDLESSAPFVSASQRRIVQGSPIYRAYATPRAPAPSTMTTAARTPPEPRGARSFTKSGRALTPTERWLVATSCGHSRVDARAAFARRGREGREALRAISADPDLPSVLRQRAAGILRALER